LSEAPNPLPIIKARRGPTGPCGALERVGQFDASRGMHACLLADASMAGDR